MYQEIELPLLPHHPLIKFLKPEIYSQLHFQIFFPEIFNSGFFDPILSNQRIRVVNGNEWMAMRETRKCLTCEGNWCEDHECQNTCVVIFNPYDRDDDVVVEENEEMKEEMSVLADEEFEEGEEQELEENTREKMQHETCCSLEEVNSLDKCSLEEVGRELEKQMKEMVSMFVAGMKVFGEKFERKLELDMEEQLKSDPIIETECDEAEENEVEEQGVEEKTKEKIHQEKAEFFDEFCRIGDKSSLDHMFERKSEEKVEGKRVLANGEKSVDQRVNMKFENFVEERLPAVDELIVYVQSSAKEQEQISIFSRKVFDANLMEPSKQVKQRHSLSESNKIDEENEGLKVVDDQAENEKEKVLISSREFLKTNSVRRFKQGEVRHPVHISFFDLVINEERILGLQNGLDGHVVNLFSFYNWYKGKLAFIFDPGGKRRKHGNSLLGQKLRFRGFLISDWEALDRLPVPYESNFCNCISHTVDTGIDMVMLPFMYKLSPTGRSRETKGAARWNEYVGQETNSPMATRGPRNPGSEGSVPSSGGSHKGLNVQWVYQLTEVVESLKMFMLNQSLVYPDSLGHMFSDVFWKAGAFPNYPKICTLLSKKFPEHHSKLQLERIDKAALDALIDSAEAHLQRSEPWLQLLQDLMAFREQAPCLILEQSSMVITLLPHNNSLIFHAFMDPFCAFVRINLFAEKISRQTP